MYSVKTALRESFDETHGGSLAFISEGNLNRSDRGSLRGEISYTTFRLFSPGLFQFLYLHIKRNPLSQHMSPKNFHVGQFLGDICWLLNAQGRKYKN